MKVGRRFYRRPYFLGAGVDISFSNWVLLSSGYKAKQYKKVQFQVE